MDNKNGNSQKSTNEDIIALSVKQKEIRMKINSTKSKYLRQKLNKERNKLMHEIHFRLKQERDKKELNKIKEIELVQNDSTKMFKVLRLMNRDKPKEKLFLKEGQEIITEDKEVTRKISNFFKDQFSSQEMEDFNNIKPTEMKIPFSVTEIAEAIKKLKNNKSSGPDEISSELLKHSPVVVYEKIAEIFNDMAKTGEFPKEIKEGLLIPISKPGKVKGKLDSLRPIILLNTIRKVLAIVMLRRIFNKIDSEIPLTQTAYRPGRSATENVFAMRVLIEKTLESNYEELNILMLDMSKAFDSINRKLLMEDLDKIVGRDELHILKLLVHDVKLQIKNDKTIGEQFNTNKGVPQGDCLSPILFTFYLANALRKDKDSYKEHSYAKENVTSETLLEKHMQDHNYSVKSSPRIDLDLQFADDTGWINNSDVKTENIKSEISGKLSRRNLLINENKTEYYKIKRKGNDNWKSCKYLGSLLDTELDLRRRKQLSMVSFRKYQKCIQSKLLSLKTRLRLLNTYVTSIFMYNSEIWTLTKALENKIDAFHRTILRRTLRINWPFIITNKEIYKRTGEVKWSKKIKTRRLRWLGHLLRLHMDTPAQVALKESNKTHKKCKGRQKISWNKLIGEDLKSVGINISLDDDTLTRLACDRDWWSEEVVVKSAVVSTTDGGGL